MVEATAEFLKTLRNSEVSGGTMMRKAIGQQHVAIGLRQREAQRQAGVALARAAASWMPARTCSQTRARGEAGQAQQRAPGTAAVSGSDLLDGVADRAAGAPARRSTR